MDYSGEPKSKGCQAVNEETGDVCGETSTLRILEDFRKLYEDRIRKISEGTDEGSDHAKLKIMEEWVKDLGEQNAMLVRTVEELEHEAANRVILLEEKLRQSTAAVANINKRSTDDDGSMTALANRVTQLMKDEETLQQRVEFLQSDIRGLLELIRRARRENCWSLDGITFFEIQPNDIPAPLDCTCGQEKEDTAEYITSLKEQVDQLKENEKQALLYQTNLEEKLAEQNKQVVLKEETIRKYISKLQTLRDNLKNRSILANQIVLQSSSPDIDLDSDESLETRDALTVEVAEKHDLVLSLREELAMLEEQCRQSDMQTHFKDDIIKEMRRELKQAKLKDTCSSTRRVRIKTDTSVEEEDAIDGNSPSQHQDEILVYLSNTKVLMEKEKEALLGLRMELQKILEEVSTKESESCIDDSNRTQMQNLKKRTTSSIESISKIYKDKEKAINLIKTAVKKRKDDCMPVKGSLVVNNEAIQHFRMMEEFRICTVEAQAATEDLREEMTNVISSLNCRHEKFIELTKLVKEIQEHLTKTRENFTDTINQFKLQEQEKLRHGERIANGAIKLKDLKNEINQMTSDLSRCIDNASDKLDECNSIGAVKVHKCDDLLSIVNDEIQQIIVNVQICQTGECNAVATLLEVRGQISYLEECFRDFQKKADEVLLDNEMAQNVFSERSKKLNRLEHELDNTHTKMQDMLENFSSVMEQISNGNSNALANQSDYHEDFLCKTKQEDIFKIKDDLRKVQKEYDDFRVKTSLEICEAQKHVKLNEWKYRVADLQDQIRELQNEARRHKEREDVLRRDLDCSEIELKKSKDRLGCCSHYKPDGMHTTCGQDFKFETIPQSFKVLQDTMQSARCGLEELSNELKKLVCEGSSHSSLSSSSFSAAMDILRKYGHTTEQCFADVDKLRNTLCSKEKLLENKEEIIRIQKDSIKMTQAELKDLHQKMQEKDLHKEKMIENLQLVQSEVQLQAQAITELEKEKARLEKENELQVQTIGNLQEAVVEAKRRLDQMGNRAASEVSGLRNSASSAMYNHGNVHDV
ncbi:putative leucine-rich repeat-containing protein DDB_G0290503 isoform X3 [Neodiprion pinetum]|uniref:putative leucine-rich repeat-containing protein DDB_G0290503 isoform X3 n=1 Tax=Neodiprion pinetum TaxID=441929 RepID=UPI003720A0D5